MPEDRLTRIEKILEELSKESKETDRRFEETDKMIKDLSRQIGGVDSRLGKFVEGFAHYSVTDRLLPFGIKVYSISARTKRTIKEKTMEIDTLCLAWYDSKQIVVVVETKVEINSEEVKEFIRKLKEFRDFFPEYKDFGIIGLVAAMVYESERCICRTTRIICICTK
jgi:uncharacterized protein with von Willebrand factor type A (vWA) domain